MSQPLIGDIIRVRNKRWSADLVITEIVFSVEGMQIVLESEEAFNRRCLAKKLVEAEKP
jgi:NifU-like protein involved in Fe-S cluster formation